MKGTDRVVLLSLAMVGLLAAFYFMVLSPKRQEASKLGDEVTQLQASIDQQNQVVQFAEQARKEFPRYYSRLVVLGKAVPDQADSASMLVQLSGISSRTGVDFRGIALSQGSSEGSSTTSASAPAPAASGTTATPSSGTATASTGTSSTTTTPSATASGDSASGSAASSATTAPSPAPATEATAATLPIGASVGPAGLPTLPYDLTFTGTYFDVANFLSSVDSLVQLRDGQVASNGRLLTINGFSLSHPTLGPNPKLEVDFAVTSYTVPADQGLTGGAVPGGPAPSPTQPEVTPVVDQ